MKPCGIHLRRGAGKAAAILILGFVVACASGDYGSLRPSSDVSDMFVKGPLSSDYRYYYSGPVNKPRAIIGIAPQFTLETTRWKPVSPDSGQIGTMMAALTGFKGFAAVNFGSTILDPQGNRIGVWYSTEADTATVKMLGDNVVAVYPPTRREGGGP